MLIAMHNGNRVEAAGAQKGLGFVCPNCQSAMTLRQGTLKVPHFAHKPPITCDWGKGETRLHLEAKNAVRDGLQRLGWRAELEWPVLSIAGDRRSDVSGWDSSGRQIAFELQHQAVDPFVIAQRTRAYMAAKVPVIWISVRDDFWEDTTIAYRGAREVKKFSARPWERWAHELNNGRLWFYHPDNRLWLGQLEPFMIRVEERSWYGEGGYEESAGGYSKVSKRWNKLTITGPYRVDELWVGVGTRSYYESKQLYWPAGPIANFVIPKSTNHRPR